MGESEKRKRFKKVATLRTNKVLEAIRVLGNCSNCHNYEYTEAEVRQMFESIDSALRQTKAKFANSKKVKQKFEFQER